MSTVSTANNQRRNLMWKASAGEVGWPQRVEGGIFNENAIRRCNGLSLFSSAVIAGWNTRAMVRTLIDARVVWPLATKDEQRARVAM